MEVTQLGFNKMFGDLWCNREDRAVRNGGDLGNLSVMVANESHMRHQCGKTIPARERGRLDHHAAQLPRLLDVRIDDLGDRLEIARLKGTLGPKEQNPCVAKKFMGEHCWLRSSGKWMRSALPNHYARS